MHHFYIESNKSYIYGFLDPYSLRLTSNSQKMIETYLSSQLRYGNKLCYLTPLSIFSSFEIMVYPILVSIF